MLRPLLATRNIKTRSNHMKRSSALAKIALYRNCKQPMSRIHKVMTESHTTRHVLYPSSPIGQCGFPGVSGEAIPSIPSPASEGLGRGGGDELSNHAGRASGSFDEFDAGYDCIFFHDDTALSANTRARGVVLFDIRRTAIGTSDATGRRVE